MVFSDLPSGVAATTEQSSPPAAPVRRPSLLPAFEPFSSSPAGLPRPSKRKLDDDGIDAHVFYPTPVPTSSTNVLTSSSPTRQTRPRLQRTVSTLSERAPLGDVPTIQLQATGEPLLLGRSSNSSDYQLPGNRQISRVHVRACYLPPNSSQPYGAIEVECLGWNGIKVHSRGEIVELMKGASYRSAEPKQIMLDVQDTRIMLLWPKARSDDISSPDSRPLSTTTGSPVHRLFFSAGHLPSSPPPIMSLPPRSPVSPTPAAPLASTFSSTFRVELDDEAVQVYEDHDSDAVAPHDPTPQPQESMPPPAIPINCDVGSASGSPLSSEPEEFSEHDEENDPIVHSFGPFGDNILARFSSFPAKSPERKRKIAKPSSFSSSPVRDASAAKATHSPIKNHVINQLAFSRSHSLPLSQIHSNLPAELRGAMAKPSDTEHRDILTTSELKSILDVIPCVGEIAREGKDAHGKLLESEFYYVPEMDMDHIRRDTVTQSLGKTSIRAARKQHKQYYWKRPR